MERVLITTFIVSSILLVLVLLNYKKILKWVAFFVVNTLVTALLLFLLNELDFMGSYYIPVNIYTVLTVSILGIPGFIMLFVLKLFVI